MRSPQLLSWCLPLLLLACLDTPTSHHPALQSFDAGVDGSHTGGEGGMVKPPLDANVVPKGCESDEECTDVKASHCDRKSGECVVCKESAECLHIHGAQACVSGKGCFECSDDKDVACSTEQVCDAEKHECVQCTGTQEEQCKDDTPHCAPDQRKCVGCRNEGDCQSPEASACTDNMCTGCQDSQDCMHLTATPLCERSSHLCVACLSNDDCPNADKSLCNTTSHQCEGCGTSDDCKHLGDTPVCLVGEQKCVECTRGERKKCTNESGEHVCDATSHACDMERKVHSKSLCNSCVDDHDQGCEAHGDCVSDDECQVGQACVHLKVPGTDQDAGWFCQWIKGGEGGAPMACNSSAQPYSKEEAAVDSIDGSQPFPVCTLRATTCEAILLHQHKCGRYTLNRTSLVVEDRFDPQIAQLIGGPADATDIKPDSSLCGVTGTCVLQNMADGAYQCTVDCISSDLNCPKGVTCGGDPPHTAGLCGV